MSADINNHDRLLAREVIAKAARNFIAGRGPDDRYDFDAVIAERWPARGTGGVAMANRRTVVAVRAAISEFYAPPPGGL